MQKQILETSQEEYLNRNNTWTNYNDIYREDWLKQLQEQNKISYKDKLVNKTIPWFILTPATIQIVFSMTKYLQQPPEVRFLAVEVFDRFMTRHYLQLHSCIWNKSDIVDKEKQRQWDRVKERVRNQFVLRVMSCVQLASKLVNNSKGITCDKAVKFLTKIGNNFTIRSVVLSERRVFQTLDFKVLNLDILYNICVSVLDVCYIQHGEIYIKLFHKITGRWDRTPTERYEYLAVECDGIFLMCAVIASAGQLLQLETATIAFKLHQETQLPASDIHDFSVIITETILCKSADTAN
ncbi:hypothetical protein L9F63_004127 [Diploptera punctata]|uniref:Cyclin N-terminal domain-containing protein n=1 Tax=Diploptera punctata TaxID=6984 RepID=A0AAD8E821_DIPPU|nr:hypothetical protein L9F63_004127 [Diploptera punctata]